MCSMKCTYEVCGAFAGAGTVHNVHWTIRARELKVLDNAHPNVSGVR